MTKQTMPVGSAERKNVPLARGVLDYFPAALAAVAALSKAGNDKHNPGEELHHARGKSTDHADCILRHLVDRGIVDPEDGIRHSVKVAWRALAMLQEELEREEGAPLPRGAKEAPGPVGYPLSATWYKSTGNIPMLALDQRVTVRFRDGSEAVGAVGRWSWKQYNLRDDIVEYRVVS